MAFDFKGAHRLVLVRPDDWAKQAFRLDKEEEVFLTTVWGRLGWLRRPFGPPLCKGPVGPSCGSRILSMVFYMLTTACISVPENTTSSICWRRFFIWW